MRGGLCLPSWRPIRPLGRQIKSALFGLGLKLKLGISPGLWLADGTGLGVAGVAFLGAGWEDAGGLAVAFSGSPGDRIRLFT
ncbi:hypothetical protein AF354_23905 [Salmonella enterica subsp. enterica serovar Typhimurium]|nr:hypothetical protein AF354_23905 [Salmonella enterica subsp. enterica serovar Typhimurium]KYE20215.1 hypothetical protein AF359_23565 [Salmonella enterica subsp. enterica serovar Typhimurium]